MSNILSLGCHTSIAWGIQNARKDAHALGATTCQIFTKSPRSFSVPSFDSDYLLSLLPQKTTYKQQGGIVHSNYLANLSKPRDQIPADIAWIIYDIKVGATLGFDCVNVHIWKGKDTTIDQAMSNMARNVEYILEQTQWYSIQYCFENTAGQGSELGSTLNEISMLYNDYLKDLGVKFVIDTAHCQWWGIDCNKRDEFVEEFDHRIGIDKIYALHLNDSKAILGAKLDRHAPLGKWCIWLPGLSKVIKRASDNNRTMILETPDMSIRPDELIMVSDIIKGEFDIDWFHRQYYMTDILKKFEELKSENGGGQWLFG